MPCVLLMLLMLLLQAAAPGAAAAAASVGARPVRLPGGGADGRHVRRRHQRQDHDQHLRRDGVHGCVAAKRERDPCNPAHTGHAPCLLRSVATNGLLRRAESPGNRTATSSVARPDGYQCYCALHGFVVRYHAHSRQRGAQGGGRGGCGRWAQGHVRRLLRGGALPPQRAGHLPAARAAGHGGHQADRDRPRRRRVRVR